MKKTLHLVCNAHLDPVWLWEWEEGLAETLSTFRTAAQFCDAFKEFIFCHNEAILYKWIEIHEPDLFRKIQQLVKKGRWHIMGGWFLQPDCNMPSGESFIRQIMVGKRYFREKFGVEPGTAINFDPFGHTRGLVQILKKTGYTSYLFCRPDAAWLNLPADDFIWVGYDGSQLLAHRAGTHYNSEKGKASEKVEMWIENNQDRNHGLLLWGIGNHGGGPSQIDLERLRDSINEEDDWTIQHSTPEAYFESVSHKNTDIPLHKGDLNPWAVGCYTSMISVKQTHRRLENTYYFTEKIVTHASMQGLMEYPREALAAALEDLLFCEFHDILPGSSIQEVEDDILNKMGHGLELLNRLKTRAFFRLLSGEPKAEEGDFPLFVYNPHPFPVDETIVFEFQPPEPNFNPDGFWIPELKNSEGEWIPCQVEKESSNIHNDHRKRVVFSAQLKPGQMNRFNCRLKEGEKKTRPSEQLIKPLLFHSDTCEIRINSETGWMDTYRSGGIDFLSDGSFRLLIMEDDADPWGMKVSAFRNQKGTFSLMNPEEAAEFAGISSPRLDPVRIIESGTIRTVVEALFQYNRSTACVRYKMMKKGNEMEVDIHVVWCEKDAMLKLSIPTPFQTSACKGQVAYGVEEYQREEIELVAQKWIGIVSRDKKFGLTVINDGTYGFDFADGELRLSLLRSPAYSGHPVDGEPHIVPQDRFEQRIDQGIKRFRFWVNGSDASHRFAHIDREAMVKAEPPMSLVCFPSGRGERSLPNISLSDDVLQLTTLKMAEENPWIIIRLFNPTPDTRGTQVSIPVLSLNFQVSMEKYEIKTMAVDIKTKDVFETDLMENKI